MAPELTDFGSPQRILIVAKLGKLASLSRRLDFPNFVSTPHTPSCFGAKVYVDFKQVLPQTVLHQMDIFCVSLREPPLDQELQT